MDHVHAAAAGFLRFSIGKSRYRLQNSHLSSGTRRLSRMTCAGARNPARENHSVTLA